MVRAVKENQNLFKPVEVRKASGLVYEELHNKIVTGEYKPGDKLPPERDLMRMYGRSHPTIREALRMLESAGMIEVLPGGGITVKEFKNSQLSVPFEESLRSLSVKLEGVREFVFVIDPIVAGLAAEHRTEEQLTRLEYTLSQMEYYNHPDQREKLFRLVCDFHVLLGEMTGNRLLYIVGMSLISMFDYESSILNRDNPSVRREELADFLAIHKRIVQAIRDQDVEAAERETDSFFDAFSSDTDRMSRLVIKKKQSLATPTKASEAIYEQIRDLIYSGELKVGDRLPSERDLSEMIGRSRASVREALKLLEQKNLIETTRGSGSVVMDFSTKEMERVLLSMVDNNLITIEDIFQLREMTEPIGAAWAAARRTPEEIDLIRNSIRNFDEKSERPELIRKSASFTVAVSKAAHNDVLYILCRVTSSLLRDRFNLIVTPDSIFEHRKDYNEHVRILKEIEKGNVRGASDATEKHLKSVRKLVKK